MQRVASGLVRLIEATGIILFIAFISGCGGTYNVLPTLTEKTKLEAEEGVVVARVINASSYPLPFNNIVIDPENLNESKKVKSSELKARTPYETGTTVFASVVKAGSYALSNINAYHFHGDYRYYRYIFSDAKFGTFQVKPGQVTDLGTLIFYPKPQTDKYIETILRLPEPELGEVMRKYFPFFEYNPENILSWEDDGKDDERESFYVSVAQNPVSYSDKYQAPDGSMYFLGKLGIILKRSADGEWDIDGVDTNLQLNTIAQNQKGDLVVGGQEGKLFWKPAGGDWQDASMAYDFTIHKVFFSKENTIDMVASQNSKLFVFRSLASPTALAWEALNQYDSVKNWKLFGLGDQAVEKSTKKKSKNKKISAPKLKRVTAVSVDENEHLIRVGLSSMGSRGAFPDPSFLTFGYDPQSWRTFKPEELPEMDYSFDSGKARLGLKKPGFWSWSGRNSYYRFDDNSKNWEEIRTSVSRCSDGTFTQKNSCRENGKKVKPRRDSFSFNSFPVFKSNLEAITIATFSNFDFWSGKRDKEIKILRTLDGGKNWQDTGYNLPNKYCASLISEVTDRLLLSCRGATSEFYESLDDGATWQQVRDHENF
ncbi:hypothetical protein [Aliikangiella coralliicola]|uniref:Uncharacterized protein n=1 Tax=Aliikangiella coralliicola TaxID=2592383 RepID=A0A545UEB8_9GAMM|nr:hypothetical protein [Aliikangiella coralliicola]TQV87808.1 hypothetical protein FLL46_10510 [Aliikangiella coralliicola]